MISIYKDSLGTILISEKDKIHRKIRERKSKLEKYLVAQPNIMLLSIVEKQYLDLLVSDYDKIVLAEPKKIEEYQSRFDAIISGIDMSSNHKKFKDYLVFCMGYKALRNSLYPKLFNQLDIKACVYCNSMLSVSVIKKNGRMTARYEVDHYLPKSWYPCFSTSYFNLYPSCGECNGRKSNNEVGFALYEEDRMKTLKSNFSFKIEKKSLVQYKLDGDLSKLKIKFHEPSNSKFNESFAIEGIYNTQLDLAEELIIKSMIYNKTYKDSLKESILKTYRDKLQMSNRLLIGNYAGEREIHKRPMAKFTQDLAKQLKLID